MSNQRRPEFPANHGVAITVAENVVRVTAPNPSVFTYHGTNSYIVGEQSLAVIDPGPDIPEHFDALISAIDGREVSHIFVTHTHRDHSPLARRFAATTGAQVYAHGPHVFARTLADGEINHLDASADLDFEPDEALVHGDSIRGNGWVMEAVYTPGHTGNHMAYALQGTGILFSGDHVMDWATTIVAPPDGSMDDYLSSLDVLKQRNDRIYLPGHGGPVNSPVKFVSALKSHRILREASILERIRAGDGLIKDIVAVIYRDTDPRMHGAAALSTFAHIERLIRRGLVSNDGAPTLHTTYREA
jgi:glyoxylase-like metal-dependent hydrolase (beta-lactamase superfamily II)